MSYNWDFEKDFIGFVCYLPRYHNEELKTYYYNLYSGNGLFIALSETEEEYQVATFAVDKEHFKNCINNNVFDDFFAWYFINCKTTRNIAKILLQNLTDENEVNIHFEKRIFVEKRKSNGEILVSKKK